jgi:hypothetical protein
MLQVSSVDNGNLAQLLKGFMFQVSSLWITETLPSCLSVSCFRFPQWITETLPSCSLYLIRQVNLLTFYSCRDPSRHFFSQSRRLLTKNFKSEVIGNWKCRCCEFSGEGHKTGVAMRVICLSPPQNQGHAEQG